MTVGRLVPAKGLDVLFEAWRGVIGALPGARLVVVGDGPLRGECEAMAKRFGLDGSVRLLGTRSDIPDILRQADVFVSSSRTEGMSNALLEALSSGLPLVATRVGGADDTVDDGVSGVLVPPGDAGALGSALRDVLASPEKRRAMGAVSRHIALDRFSLEKIVDQYLALFQELGPAA